MLELRNNICGIICIISIATVLRADDALGGALDLTVDPGFVKNVWGFCQGKYAAPLTGGWVDKNSSTFAEQAANLRSNGTCHMGGSDFTSAFSMLPQDNCNLTEAAANTCNCIAVPQCGRGSSCSFDCSCSVSNNTDGSAVQVNRLLNSTHVPTFVGSIAFADGQTFDLECSLILPVLEMQQNGTHLHGYTVTISGAGERNRRCPDVDGVQEPETMHSSYNCSVAPVLKHRPLEAGDVFEQHYLFSGASRLGFPSTALLLVAMASYFGL